MAAKPRAQQPAPATRNAIEQAFQDIDRKRRRPWRNEEEVRLAWIAALERATGLDFDAERGKRDSNYNNVIIEFKGPGLFKGSYGSAKFREAVNRRLLPYIQRAAAEQTIPEADFIGIAIDGEHICFAQVRDGKIYHNHLLPFSKLSLGMVVAACMDSMRPAVVAENLIKDFGHVSVVATDVMQVLADALSAALARNEASKIRMLFEEWRSLYGQVADLSADQREAIDASLRFIWRGPAADSMAGRLFVIHTYNSLLIKLLAAEIVAAHGLAAEKAPAEAMCALLTPELLFQKLDADIEQGNLFAASNINGFVEEAIFSWYLEAGRNPQYRDDLAGALKALLGKLALYRTDRLERQRDTLRDFYQDLVPDTLRKSLGEFYTPDWLVDLTVAKVSDGGWLGRRLLDPTCGSGSFLISLIRRKKEAARAAGHSAEETIQLLCNEVWGFDLNPLAVQTARVNFLMEIADLLAAAPGTSVELPVLLADAIYSPAHDPATDEAVVTYEIGSEEANLIITLPKELAFDRQRLDSLLQTMGECVEDDREYDDVAAELVSLGKISTFEGGEWRVPLRATYDQVLALHRKNWNGIWFRIVRNFFWSATAGQFDAVVGNPPWVRWSSLPEAYRNRVKKVCRDYDIFSQTGHHGGNELDISAMITYTTGDKWLREGGKLAFVITQSVFQNPSSSGFRNFHINEQENLSPISVDDLKALKPFPDAANKTAVAVFEKTIRKPAYPVPYTIWHAAVGATRSVNPVLSLSQVLAKVDRKVWEATPVSGEGSPWAVLPKGRFGYLQPMSEVDDKPWVEGRKGITVDLNGVYFVNVIGSNAKTGKVRVQSRPEAGRKDIGARREAWIEPDWLYPLIKGASDFSACYLEPVDGLFAIVPNQGIRRGDYEKAATDIKRLKGLKGYLEHFNESKLLEQRSTYRGRMVSQGAPYFAIYNVGDFTFAPWKVIWAEMSGKFCAAVAGKAEVPLLGPRVYVPDHKIYFVALSDRSEAHFLCGMLNSSVVAEFVESHNVAIQVGDIFKHMKLPTYDKGCSIHNALARKVEAAHKQQDPDMRAPLVAEVTKDADVILDKWLSELKRIRRGRKR